jgi:valyl-tRNA synthetase
VKLLNASKFALAGLPPEGAVSHPLDRALLARMGRVIDDATAALDSYEYTRALERTEEAFWWYCDYYLELIKGRRYEGATDAAASVSRALRCSLSAFQRLFAPFLPFVCEEVWSWWQQGSVHRAPWPTLAELAEHLEPDDGAREELALQVAADALREVRKAKSQARLPMRAPVERIVVRDTPERLDVLSLGADDLRAAGAIEQVLSEPADQFAVEVSFAEAPGG